MILQILLFSLFAVSEPSTPEVRETYHLVLDPKERTKLSARISSPIYKIEKKMGDSFEKGERLILLDSAIYEAALKKAEAELEKATTELSSKKALFEEKSASLFELKEAEYNAAHAKSEVAIAKETLGGTEIIAPYRGKVASVFFEERELPKGGDVLIEIIRDETLLARFLASSKLNLKIGQEIVIKLDETGEELQAKITRISPDIDPSSGTIKVEAEIDNSEGRYKAGTSGEVKL